MKTACYITQNLENIENVKVLYLAQNWPNFKTFLSRLTSSILIMSNNFNKLERFSDESLPKTNNE